MIGHVGGAVAARGDLVPTQLTDGMDSYHWRVCHNSRAVTLRFVISQHDFHAELRRGLQLSRIHHLWAAPATCTRGLEGIFLKKGKDARIYVQYL